MTNDSRLTQNAEYASAIEHHLDCDHWRISHRTVCEQVSRQGGGMWRDHCEEPGCVWQSMLYGPDARASMARRAQAHGNVWTQCVGECSSWDDPAQIDSSGGRS